MYEAYVQPAERAEGQDRIGEDEDMTNEQIVAIGAPMAFNGAIIGVMVLWVKAKFDAIPSALTRKRSV